MVMEEEVMVVLPAGYQACSSWEGEEREQWASARLLEMRFKWWGWTALIAGCTREGRGCVNGRGGG